MGTFRSCDESLCAPSRYSKSLFILVSSSSASTSSMRKRGTHDGRNYTLKLPLSLIIAMRYAVGRSFRKHASRDPREVSPNRLDAVPQEPFQKTSQLQVEAGVGGRAVTGNRPNHPCPQATRYNEFWTSRRSTNRAPRLHLSRDVVCSRFMYLRCQP